MSSWASATYVRHLDCDTGSHLWPGLVLVFVGIWVAQQQLGALERLSVCLTPCLPLWLLNKHACLCMYACLTKLLSLMCSCQIRMSLLMSNTASKSNQVPF